MVFNVEHVRSQFPALSTKIYGKDLVYLDNAASVQKPQVVLDQMQEVYTTFYANVHRGLHYMANKTTAAYESAREKIATYLNASSVDNVVFTMGGTDAINLVAGALGREKIKQGDEIILTVMEHHSNIVPWHFLREYKGAVLKWLEVDANGHIDMDAYEALLTQRTKMVAVTHLSNVLGAMPPITRMARMAHAVGAQILVDGCQGSVHGPVDVTALEVDYYVMTGHKLYGPNGVGVLYGTTQALATLPPFRGGGEMIETVTRDHVAYSAVPRRFEAGTPPIMEVIALGAAVEWLAGQDIAGLQAHERALTDHAMTALRDLGWVTLYGQGSEKGPVIAFNIKDVHPHDVSTILDRYGVAIRAGHHCCQPLMTHLGVSATARASFASYNTHAEIDVFIAALGKAYEMLR